MRLLAALFALALLVAGCGGDDDDAPLDGDAAEIIDDEGDDEGELEQGFDVQLNGTNEVPGPGSEFGTGTGAITFAEGEVCVEADVTLDEPPVAMHIHEGAVDESGPVVVGFGDPTRDDGWSTCVDADQALIDEIVSEPTEYYLNVHNAEFPDGAVRGQLARE